tara:strand:+ start:38934 stop:39539 length:606 start_codon:yes stop_codon:yes gene_type:complete
MKRLYFALLILIVFLTGPSCQTKSKNSVGAPSTPSGDPWYASARLGDWVALENLQKNTNRDWDYTGANGVTVLMIASRNGQLDYIKNLISKNVNVNLIDEHKHNALSYSLHGPISQELKNKTCTLLVQNGANAFSEDLLQLTPIQIMIEYEFLECIKEVKFTVSKPCDQADKLEHIKSLVTYAEKEEAKEIVTYLKSQGCQ